MCLLQSRKGDCAADASPVSVERAIAALRRHGFDAVRDDFGCSPYVAASLTLRDDAQDDLYLTCYVLADAKASGSLIDMQVLSGPKLERIDRQVENVQCTLYVAEPTDEAVQRLDAVVSELKP